MRQGLHFRSNSMPMMYSVFVLTMVFWLQSFAAVVFPSNVEMTALHDLYYATGGQYWVFDSDIEGIPWSFDNSSNPCGSPQWYGVTCLYFNNTVYIEELSLYSSNLTGTIPSSIGNFSELAYINFDANYLHGTLPVGVGALTKMVYFSITGCALVGSLPAVLSQWNQSIKYFFVNENQLTGTFPSFVASWLNLAQFGISHNKFTGILPDFVGNLVKLNYFDVVVNYFNGTIPESLGNLVLLTDILLACNFLTGTLPSSLGTLTQLTAINMAENKLSGSIPDSYGNLAFLSTFNLYLNQLNGTIPSTFGNLTSMVVFSVADNELTGSLPESLCSWINIEEFYVFSNQMTGSLPSAYATWSEVTDLQVVSNQFTGTVPAAYANMTKLEVWNFQTNYFHGSIPLEYCDLINLISLDGYQNSLTGTLPACLGSWTMMNAFIFFANSLTGSIPDSQAAYAVFEEYEVHNNLLTGSIPESFGNFSEVYLLNLENNFLSGTIPKALGYLPSLSTLHLNNNSFSGIIPTSFSSNAVISDLLMYSNALSGSIELLFNSTAQLQLATINFNENFLTGTIPDEVFLLPKLTTLGLVSNCLQSSLSDVMCSPLHLTGLILDGVGTASACQSRIFPGIKKSTSYQSISKYQMTGSLPECLFTMPALTTLHLSGNSITGTFPSYIDSFLSQYVGSLPPLSYISESLIDLSLSHNALSGTLSSLIQSHPWLSFDVSFNRLTGMLKDFNSTTEAVNSSFSFQVNRFSGNIPVSLTFATDIRLVNGNLFNCGIIDRNTLPAADPATSNYQCGSNLVNLALYLCIISVLFLCVVAAVGLYRKSRWLAALRSGYVACVHSELSNIKLLNQHLKALLRSLSITATVIVVLMLPTYGTLSSLYSTYTNKYAWIESAAFLSGVTPGAVLLCFYAVILAFFCIQTREWKQNTQILEDESKSGEQWWRIFTLSTANVLAVVGVNALYVYVLIKSPSQLLNFCVSVFTAAFKMIWNEYFLPAMFRMIHQRRGQYFAHRVCLQLFNTILTPIAVLGTISSNCFYYALANSQPVTATVEFYSCLTTSFNGTCTDNAYYPIQSSYDPPFTYNYECTSTFVTDYSSVFVYMFLISGLIKPAYLLLVHRLYEQYPERCLLKMLLPRLLQVALDSDSESLRGKQLFNVDRVIMKYIVSIALLLSFGVVFPLLSLVIVFDAYSYAIFNQACLGHVLLMPNSPYEASLNNDCGPILGPIDSILWIVIPFVGIFYSLFLWDIVGDAVGPEASLWAPLLMTLLPISYYTVLSCVSRSGKKEADSDSAIELYTRKGIEISNPIV